MSAHNTFSICQSDLAQKIGRPVEEIRALRDAHLKSGEDWQIDAHNRVAYTVAAAEKLAGLAAHVSPEVAAKEVSRIATEETVLVVAKKFPNTRIFNAKVEGTDKTVVVRCRDSRQRRIGERVKARELPGGGVWEFVAVVRTFRQGAAR